MLSALRLEPSLRQQIQIVTKTGIRAGATPGHYNLSYDYILKRVEESLEALGVTYVDVSQETLSQFPEIFLLTTHSPTNQYRSS